MTEIRTFIAYVSWIDDKAVKSHLETSVLSLEDALSLVRAWAAEHLTDDNFEMVYLAAIPGSVE